MLKRFIGSKAFYKNVLTLLIPMVIQQFITSFVSLLDNIMVGSLGTESISAASISNSVLMVHMLAIFGGMSGASIYGAQFFGKGDMDGMRHTFRFKLYFGVLCSAVAIAVYLLFGSGFILSFLQGDSNGGDLALTHTLGNGYLRIMLWGLIPFALAQVYTGTMRESGETRVPMVAGIIAILTNLFLNWVLIYGHLGAPVLGVEGAAIATVISRYVELLVVVVHSHRHTDRYVYLMDVYKNFRVPAKLVGKISRTAAPLLVNEILWSLGMTFITNFYSSRGLNAVAALNINGTAFNLFCVIMFAMGSAVSIMVGQRLGAGEMEEARDVDRKLIFLTEVIHIIMGILLMLVAPLIPQLYNVSDEVRELTCQLIMVVAVTLPVHSFAHVAYFTIRSGGRTVITFLFDALYTWAVSVVLAFCLTRFTDLPIIHIYFIVMSADLIKVVIGVLMIRSGFWVRNVVNDTAAEQS